MIWQRVMLAVSSADNVPSALLDRVGRIARGLQAEVDLFHCLYEPDIVQPRPHGAPVDAVIAARVDERHRSLERLADTLRAQGLKAHASVRWDYPMYEGIIRQVLRHKPDLLILSAARTPDVSSRTLTYREARLIEECPCPLLLLKTPEVYSKGCVVAAVDPMHAYEVPEELDEAIIAAAKTMAHALADAPVHVYHAVAPSPQSASGTPAAGSVQPPHDSGYQLARRATAAARVRELASLHNISGARVRVETGNVESALPDFAREVHADIVVMGAVSRTYPERARFGHTAEKVLDAVHCDVLVVKPQGFQTPVSPDASPAAPQPPMEPRPAIPE